MASVINTNTLSMVTQQNLNQSQNALNTSMERLSSGLRINSAKDDAAGQAIANRMDSQITGLSQAQRNANDGISVAQTAEGALNQVNDNLQRVRELTVQAQSGTNNADDLSSIQDEITMRMEEIERITEQTSFNGINVLESDQNLSIQVGSNDGELIDIKLQAVSSSTLGMSGFDITNTFSSKNLTEVVSGGTVNTTETASIKANAYSPAPGTADLEAEGVYEKKTGDGYVVKAENGQYYELTTNENTGKMTWDSGSSSVAASDVNETQAVTSITEKTTAPLTVNYVGSDSFLADGSTTVSGIYQRNDIEQNYIDDPASDTITGYATKGTDGKFYEVELSVDTTDSGYDVNDKSTWVMQATLVGTDEGTGNGTKAVEVSIGNISNSSATETEIGITETSISSNDDLKNEALASAPVSTGLYALSDGSGYAVKADNDEYYAATVASDGGVTWDSSTTSISSSKIDTTTGTIDNVLTGTTTITPTGLAENESLYQLADADGASPGSYVVKSTDDNGNTTYNSATLDTDTGLVTKSEDILTFDPLSQIDNALKTVDTLRSGLGAVQNRFDSAITNLATTETNLSAAQSRIQDADYAEEVSSMTTAQILQQAGTSMLTQANQVPQNVLSLLG
ncbi:flagellin [Cobetia sp. D5]|uniref:flagellin N-terminal helical domain-containing protein n=1 Tax=Cobetia sp. D5 TaxID=3105867 RepID=UPI002D76B3E4|nr:flagellin [Cobetia sp. D5]